MNTEAVMVFLLGILMGYGVIGIAHYYSWGQQIPWERHDNDRIRP